MMFHRPTLRMCTTPPLPLLFHYVFLFLARIGTESTPFTVHKDGSRPSYGITRSACMWGGGITTECALVGCWGMILGGNVHACHFCAFWVWGVLCERAVAFRCYPPPSVIPYGLVGGYGYLFVTHLMIPPPKGCHVSQKAGIKTKIPCRQQEVAAVWGGLCASSPHLHPLYCLQIFSCDAARGRPPYQCISRSPRLHLPPHPHSVYSTPPHPLA